MSDKISNALDKVFATFVAYQEAKSAGTGDEFMLLEQGHFDRTGRYRTDEQRAIDRRLVPISKKPS